MAEQIKAAVEAKMKKSATISLVSESYPEGGEDARTVTYRSEDELASHVELLQHQAFEGRGLDDDPEAVIDHHGGFAADYRGCYGSFSVRGTEIEDELDRDDIYVVADGHYIAQ